MFDTYQQGDYSMRPSLLNGILVTISSSDVSRKIMSGWGGNSGPVISLQDGYQRKHQLSKLLTPQHLEGTRRHMGLCGTQNFPNSKKKSF